SVGERLPGDVARAAQADSPRLIHAAGSGVVSVGRAGADTAGAADFVQRVLITVEEVAEFIDTEAYVGASESIRRPVGIRAAVRETATRRADRGERIGAIGGVSGAGA